MSQETKPKLELIDFSITKCKNQTCFCFEGVINESPKKLQIYIANRWGNVLQEYENPSGCFFPDDLPSGIYHVVMIGKYKKKETVQVQLSIEYAK